MRRGSGSRFRGRAAAWIVPVALTIGLSAGSAAASSGLRFFEPDSHALKDTCERVLLEVSSAWRERPEATPPGAVLSSRHIPRGPFRVGVHGHADASEAARGNDEVATRRARAVADFLIAHGVPRTHVTYRGLGAGNPLVPTGSGVAEPQNRRVEIISR